MTWDILALLAVLWVVGIALVLFFFHGARKISEPIDEEIDRATPRTLDIRR